MLQFIKDITRPIRHRVMSLVRSARLAMDVQICRKNFSKQLVRCRDKIKRGEKIRVMFLVSELSKWKTQSLFERMESSDQFEPFVAVSCRGFWYEHPEYKSLLDETIKAFQSKGLKYEVVADFNTMQNIPLKKFRPDIVFYEQPYDWKREYLPITVSRFALTAYVPYYVPTNEIDPLWYVGEFHRTNFLYILLNDQIKDALDSYLDPKKYAGQTVALGHTFYDLYGEASESPNDGNGLVIYAPHWAFDHPRNVNSQNISTFLWNGREILAYAKAHPEVKWLFKPHPGLRWRLIESGAWTKDEIEAYYQEWDKIGECYYGDDYVQLFKKSRVMITDCGSFLAEYPPCGGALIHLRSATEKSVLLRSYAKMYDSFYQVHDLKDLYETLDMVVVRGEDPKHNERMQAVRDLKLIGNDAAKNIVDYLLNMLS